MPKKPRFDLSPPRSRGGAAATVVVVVRLKPAKLETEPIPLALSLEVNPGGSIASVWPHPLLSLSPVRPRSFQPPTRVRQHGGFLSLSSLVYAARERERENCHGRQLGNSLVLFFRHPSLAFALIHSLLSRDGDVSVCAGASARADPFFSFSPVLYLPRACERVRKPLFTPWMYEYHSVFFLRVMFCSPTPPPRGFLWILLSFSHTWSGGKFRVALSGPHRARGLHVYVFTRA